jgi:hypothetical protein
MTMENSTAVERGDAPAGSHGPDRTDGDGPQFLRARRAMRDDSRLAGHPVVAFIVVALIGFVLLAAVTVLIGWLLKTYVLPEHGIGHADEHVNVWLAHHRDGTRNDVSFWRSRRWSRSPPSPRWSCAGGGWPGSSSPRSPSRPRRTAWRPG